MNIYTTDIRLLVIFDAVMRERNVTRAAERVGLTQPAVSNALGRLRAILKDELFERTGQGMRPTARAIELADPVHQALRQIETAMVTGPFRPETAVLTITMAMSDQVGVVILPPLAKRLEREAPGITIRVRPKIDPDLPRQLDSNDIDLAVGVFHERLPRFQYASLYRDRYVCVVRSGHPLAKAKMSLGNYLNARHLLVRSAGDSISFLDGVMEHEGLHRRVVMSTGQVLAVPDIIRNSDLITVLLERTADQLHAGKTLLKKQLPFKTNTADVSMLWHSNSNDSPAGRWFRSLLTEICRQ